jgi:hypothetical protein
MNIIPGNTIDPSVSENTKCLQIINSNNNIESVRLLAVGDIGFSGRIRRKYQGKYQDIFTEVKSIITNSDIFFGNLETPLIFNSDPSNLFAGDPLAAESFQNLGTTYLNLANNHILDYGKSGFLSTIEYLKQNKITPLGYGNTIDEAKKIVISVVNGIKIGWLSCARTHIRQENVAPFYWEFNEFELFAEIQKSKTQVDFLIVSLHTGLMYLDIPDPEMKSATEKMMELGVNCVLMHHAHVLQSIYVLNDNKVCFFNMGNFLFDSTEGNVKIPIFQKEQNESGIFVVDIGKNEIINAFVVPIFLDEDLIIRFAKQERSDGIVNRLLKNSAMIKFDYVKNFEKQRVERNSGPVFQVIYFHLFRGNYKIVWGILKNIRIGHLAMVLNYLKNKFLGKS